MPVRKTAGPTPAPKTAGAAPAQSAPAGNGGGNGGGAVDRSALFDNAKATGQVDNGKYEGIITELVLQPEDEKGQSVRIKYTVASKGDAYGETLTQWYKIFEADGSQGKGLGFLKRDLAILGYDNVSFNELEDAFDEIVDNRTGVVFQVKQNGQFTNCYLQGLAEDSDIIREYIDTNPL